MTAHRDQVAELIGVLNSFARTIRLQGTRVRELGASGTGFAVLTALSRGDARPGDLAVALQVGPSVISRVVAPLENAGLIERKPEPADARACLLALTPLGRSRLRDVQDALIGRLASSLGDWSDDEVSQASLLIGRIDHALTHDSPLDHFATLAIEKAVS